MSFLYSKFYPATQSPICDIPLVLLHGWGTDSRSWIPLLSEENIQSPNKTNRQLNKQFNVITLDLPNFGQSSHLHSTDLDAWIDVIVAALPERSILLGWSLGGMLATQISARYPQRVAALITLASNLSFVQQEHWLTALSAEVDDRFYKSFMASPPLALKRFCALQAQGETAERESVKALRGLLQLTSIHINNGWGESLQLLSKLDNRELFSQLSCPGLHFFAQNDALVPMTCAEKIRGLNSTQQVSIINGCGHAFHLYKSDAQLDLLTQLEVFLQSQNFLLSETTGMTGDTSVCQTGSPSTESYAIRSPQ